MINQEKKAEIDRLTKEVKILNSRLKRISKYPKSANWVINARRSVKSFVIAFKIRSAMIEMMIVSAQPTPNFPLGRTEVKTIEELNPDGSNYVVVKPNFK